MKRTELKRTKGLKPTSHKTALRNKRWKFIVMERAKYLISVYGYLCCEYSGERILCLSSVPNDLDDGWGHHINGNRNDCNIQNCYITKYRFHSVIHDSNLKVVQEDFQGRVTC